MYTFYLDSNLGQKNLFTAQHMDSFVLFSSMFRLFLLTEKPQYVYQSVSESVDDTKKQTNIGVISTRTTMGILSVFGVALTGWSFFNSAANRGFLRRKRSKKIRYSDLKI